VTSTAFVAANAAAFLLRGIVLTGTTTIIMTAAIAGAPIPTPTVSAAITGNLTGANVATTANTPAAALAAGEAEDMLNSLYKNADIVLRRLPNKEKVFLVSDTVYQNYLDYQEAQSTERSHTILLDGIEYLTYRGIVLINMDWDKYLAEDFPCTSTYLPGYPHRIIYTHVYNLVLGMDIMNQYTAMNSWYNADVQENRFRMMLVMGVQYVHNKLTALAY